MLLYLHKLTWKTNLLIESSHLLIVNSIEETLNSLLISLPKHSTRVIKNEEKSEFLIAQANLAIKEAYIATNKKKFIILCGTSFRTEAQNSLLKVLEEPPSNIVFIIITNSKSSILPTILSRIPHKFLKKPQERKVCDLDLMNLDLKDVYNFLKINQKISKLDAKNLVESMLFKIKQQNISLSTKELDIFSKAIKLIDLNSRPISILTTLLLALSQRKI